MVVDSMSNLIPVLISGFASGSCYALLALAIVITFRSTDTVNFAIGDIGMIGAYVAFSAIGNGLPVVFGLLIALAVGGSMGVGVERVLIRPLGHRPNIVFIALVVTIGLGLLLRALAGAVWGHAAYPFPQLVPGSVTIAGIAIGWNKIIATLAALCAMAAVAWFFGRTAFGAAMRASAEDPFAARVIGLSTNRIAAIASFLSCILGTLAIFFLAAESSLSPVVAMAPLFRGIAGVFLGGMTSMPGAVFGGFAIGVLDNIAGSYVSANFRDTVVFAIIVLVLFMRPAGFLGQARKERV